MRVALMTSVAAAVLSLGAAMAQTSGGTSGSGGAGSAGSGSAGSSGSSVQQVQPSQGSAGGAGTSSGAAGAQRQSQGAAGTSPSGQGSSSTAQQPSTSQGAASSGQHQNQGAASTSQQRQQNQGTASTSKSTSTTSTGSVDVNLSGEQRTRVVHSLSTLNIQPVQENVSITVGQTLPTTVTHLYDCPETLTSLLTGIRQCKVVLVKDRYYIVDASSRRVVTVIERQG